MAIYGQYGNSPVSNDGCGLKPNWIGKMHTTSRKFTRQQ